MIRAALLCGLMAGCELAVDTDDLHPVPLVHIAGTYDVAITSYDNGCMIASWDTSSVLSGTVNVTQTGDLVTIQGDRLIGSLLTLALNTSIFQGTSAGNTFDLAITGAKVFTSGNCMYTYNSHLTGSADGPSISGRIDFTSVTTSASDCATYSRCDSYQLYTGTRQ